MHMKLIKQHFSVLPETIAAIDLGSNSFHMLIAKHENGNLIVIDQLKESVRLRAGLDEYNNLSDEATQRALDCLARFGQRIQHFPARGVRIVGTNTLRLASNSSELLEKAEELLGHRIEIISGIEEARLIYIGVAHHVEEDNGRRMVIDIGGGSTEITLGDRFDPVYIKSFEMGSVFFTQRFFEDGKLSKKRLRQAITTAELELEPYVEHYKKLNWADVIGASGTIKSVANVAFKMGWCNDGISAESMNKLFDEIAQYTHIDDIKLNGLKTERKPVFAGGFIVLKAIFDTFKIQHMRVSEGALREGLLYDLIGREEYEDTRSRTIQSWAKRYNVDRKHAEAVADTALNLFSQIAKDWKIDDDECQKWLYWSASIHEIGLIIAHNQSHKHGEYIIRNADLAGFSREDQKVLATLIRTQRNRFSPDFFNTLDEFVQVKTRKLSMLLRCAVLLNRSRHYENQIIPLISAHDDQVRLVFPENYLEQHPLTSADLYKEQALLEQGGMKLDITTVADVNWNL